MIKSPSGNKTTERKVMINKSYILRPLTLSIALAAIVLVSGFASETYAQRDPFAKPAWAKTRDNRPGAPGVGKGSGPVINLGIPSIESRIDYYKRVRESAAASGQPIPKVTSVLSLNEMAVTGIFRTPRGYAAMVEAMPIKLSYTIYPGEKFFDGQLVAVEENRLVFRKVTKISSGKFVSSVENKALRKYTEREQIQGTAPMQTETAGNAQPRAADTAAATSSTDGKTAAPTAIVSPLDEMNKQVTAETSKAKPEKPSKKPVRVAKKN